MGNELKITLNSNNLLNEKNRYMIHLYFIVCSVLEVQFIVHHDSRSVNRILCNAEINSSKVLFSWSLINLISIQKQLLYKNLSQS